MMVLLAILGGAWAAWCLFALATMLLCPLWLKPRGNAYTNGLVIYVAPDLAERLTPRELEAIRAHEFGHIHHGHAWRNLARACVFRRRHRGLELAQEHEADDYAYALGHGLYLASALHKMTIRARDRARGARLLDRRRPRAA